ncbi:unnamed protein product [Effrenium voratum]|nr:unnamed protein product [Effrenium voratum]
MNLIIASVHIFVIFWLFNLVMYSQISKQMTREFGYGETDAVMVSLTLFMLLLSPSEQVMSLLMTMRSRANEFQADSFAAKMGRSEPLQSGLFQIHEENKACFAKRNPSSASFYLKTPQVERLRALRALDSESKKDTCAVVRCSPVVACNEHIAMLFVSRSPGDAPCDLDETKGIGRPAAAGVAGRSSNSTGTLLENGPSAQSSPEPAAIPGLPISKRDGQLKANGTSAEALGQGEQPEAKDGRTGPSPGGSQSSVHEVFDISTPPKASPCQSQATLKRWSTAPVGSPSASFSPRGASGPSPSLSPRGSPQRNTDGPMGSPLATDFKTPKGWSPANSMDFGVASGSVPSGYRTAQSSPKLGVQQSPADQSLLAKGAADGDEWRGWTIQTSPQGKLFYHHIASNTSQWQMPRELAPVLGEWTQVEEEGKRYWRNEKLGVSSWKDPRRTTNLFQAALDGNLFFLQLYTEVGGFLDAVDSKGRTALHYNCAGGSSQAVHYLLQHGASVDLADRSGSTPLHWAARYGHAPIVRLLLESKAHPDYQNNMGDTAMHEAAALGLAEPLQWLVLAKANLSLRNRESRTPIEVAHSSASKDALQLLQQHEDELDQSESDASRSRARRARLERRAHQQVTSPEPERDSSEEDEPSLALVVVRAARPLLRSVQWLANRVLGEKKTNLGDTSRFSYDHTSGQWVLPRQSAEDSASSAEEQTWSLPETKQVARARPEESDGGMA